MSTLAKNRFKEERFSADLEEVTCKKKRLGIRSPGQKHSCRKTFLRLTPVVSSNHQSSALHAGTFPPLMLTGTVPRKMHRLEICALGCAITDSTSARATKTPSLREQNSTEKLQMILQIAEIFVHPLPRSRGSKETFRQGKAN